MKWIARTHGLCACRWINNDPWSSKADQATSSHCRTKSHSTKIRRSRPVFWQPVQCQWECNVRRLKPNFSINAGSIKAINYSHNIPHDSAMIVTIYWLLAVMLAFISFTINSRKTAWVLRTARILSADHLVYSSLKKCITDCILGNLPKCFLSQKKELHNSLFHIINLTMVLNRSWLLSIFIYHINCGSR